MRKTLPVGRSAADVLFFLEAAAIALFIWRRLSFEAGSPLHGKPALSAAVLAALLIILTSALSVFLKAYVSLFVSKTGLERREIKRSLVLTLAPFLLLGLSFFQPALGLNPIDPALLTVSSLGFAYLQLVLSASLKGARPVKPETPRTPDGPAATKWDARPLSRRLFPATLLAYILYLSGLVTPPLTLTGDEPHYLLIAKSLLADGDINLYNNYMNKDYLKFYPGELDLHAYPGKKGERYLYSKHQPALSVLVAPFYLLGEKAGALVSSRGGGAGLERRLLISFCRLPVCVLAALLSIAFFLYAAELTRNKGAAILSWLVFSFASPYLFYSHLLYPEIPVALILLTVSFRVIQKKDFSARSLFWAGAGIGFLPWWGIKYVVPAGTLALIIGYLWLRRPGAQIRKALAFGGPILLSAGLYLSLLLLLYGKLSPQTVYLGAGPVETRPHFIVSTPLDFLSRLLGYLFDQRAGIFAVAPVYVLLIPGLFILARRSKKETLLLAGLFSVFWAFCSLNYFYWGGYCPPGRPLLPVLWVGALFMAVAFSHPPSRAATVVRDGLAFAGFFIAALFIQSPGLLFQESLGRPGASASLGMDSHLLTRLSNIFIDWTALVPSLSAPRYQEADWTPLLIWIPAVLGISALFLFARRPAAARLPSASLRVHLGGAVLLGLVFVANAWLNIKLDRGVTLEGDGFEVFAQDTNAFPPELGGFWVKGRSRAVLVIRTPRPAPKLSLSLSSPVEGKTKVRLDGAAREVERKQGAGLERSIIFTSPRSFPWKGSRLYRLEVEESSGFYPSKIDPESRDNRFLGVFIRIEAGFAPSGPGQPPGPSQAF